MNLSLLQELGLTKGEAAVYLALLDLGETRVGRVIEKSGLASSAVHNALHTLAEKGLVSHILKGKVRHYRATPPRELLTLLDDRRKRLQEALPELELRRRLAETKTRAEVYEGAKGVMAMLNELIANAHKGDSYRFFAVDVEGMNEEIQEFFTRYDAKRKEKGLVIRGLAPHRLAAFFSGRSSLGMRYTHDAIPANTMLCDGKIAFVTWGEKPSGILICSEQLAEKHSVFFDALWKSVKS